MDIANLPRQGHQLCILLEIRAIIFRAEQAPAIRSSQKQQSVRTTTPAPLARSLWLCRKMPNLWQSTEVERTDGDKFQRKPTVSGE
ncbi:MAG: hypothetical protein DWH78_15350 [Planctomycetota bacterium]|nr:MAG: hypothetical protein DWH78_15350 [Planctomycetota bacterium]